MALFKQSFIWCVTFYSWKVDHFSCKDTAQQVLMYVCLSFCPSIHHQIEILPSQRFPKVTKCSWRFPKVLQGSPRLLQGSPRLLQGSPRLLQGSSQVPPRLLQGSSTHQYTTVHTSTHQHTPVHTSAHQYRPVHTSTDQYTPVQTSTHQYTPVHTSTHQYTPVNTCTHPYTPVLTRTHQYTLLHTSDFPEISLILPNDIQSLPMCRQAAWAGAGIVRCCTLSGASAAGLGEPADYTQPIRLSSYLTQDR